MEIIEIRTRSDIEQAAELAALEHRRLRGSLPFLPKRDATRYVPKIEWMTNKGHVIGLRRDGALKAFLGGFILDDFRNAGRGSFSPDWCRGVQEEDAFSVYRLLYRELASAWVDEGARIQAFAAYAPDEASLRALSLSGFGRIVMDAACPTAMLASGLNQNGDRGKISSPRTGIRLAGQADADTLAALQAHLAAHIGASPVFVPRAQGMNTEEWSTWLSGKSAVAFIAEAEEEAIGFIKADIPQFDVSDSVHGKETLAISGLFVSQNHRRKGVGESLLRAIVEEAEREGKTLVSVDCETTNLEAYAFWSRHFHPVSWSFERRV